MAAGEGLEDQLKYFAASFDEVSLARARLAETFVAGLDDSISPLVHHLGRVGFEWKYGIVRKNQQVVLFFFERPQPDAVVVDVRLRCDTVPIPPPPWGEHPRLVRWQCLLRWPALVVRSATPESSDLLFDLPDGRRMRVVDAEEGAWHASLQVPQAEGDGSDFTYDRKNGWRLEPFLAWLEALRSWRLAPTAGAPWTEIGQPTPQDAPIARRILGGMIDVYEKLSEQIRRPQSRPGSGTSDALACCQAITLFEGSTHLRLSEDGRQIAEEKEDNPLTLQLTYRITRHGDLARLEVELAPPDFLLSGEHHAAIVAAFRLSLAAEGGYGRFRVGGVPIYLGPKQLKALFDQDEASALILRVGRSGEVDTDILVLRGWLSGVELVLVFAADLKISAGPAGAKPVASLLRRSPSQKRRVSLLRPQPKAGWETVIDEQLYTEVVDAFLRLMLALHRWGGVLP